MEIGPRIGRLYQNENLVRILQHHCTREDDGLMRDLWDTSKWKQKWYGMNGLFKGDPKGITMSFCTDGVNPYKTMHHVYSMWPLMITIMNFPIALRKSVGGILLLGMVFSREDIRVLKSIYKNLFLTIILIWYFMQSKNNFRVSNCLSDTVFNYFPGIKINLSSPLFNISLTALRKR